MYDKRKKAFIVLAPLDPYFLSIFSELVSRLAKTYPNYLILIVPVWGIKFGGPCAGSNCRQILKSLKANLGYYKSQLMLSYVLRQMFYRQGLCQLPKNTIIVNHIYCRLASRTRYSLRQELARFATHFKDYSIGAIKAGDLIIDTFLRYRPSASFLVGDPFVVDIIRISRSYHAFFEYLLNKYHVKAVFGSYTTYVQHGIPHRLCQYKRIESYTFGAASTFYRRHASSSFLSHATDHTSYSIRNHKIESARLRQAEASLVNRIYGKKDTTISYMRKFSTEHSVHCSVAGKHIIFLHDFFDSPHIYRWMLHRDFYHWVTDTLDTLNRSGLEVFIKPHPNQCNESSEVVEKLKSSYSAYSNINWLSEKTANITILHHSPLLVVTVYGSIIAESAYCGVRAISAGDHPAINCCLSYDPVDLSDYHQKLVNPELIPAPHKNNAIAFLAQHAPEYSEANIPSLVQQVGLSFSEIDDNSDVLLSSSAKRFLAESVDKLLVAHIF